jgi:hypothetical protein
MARPACLRRILVVASVLVVLPLEALAQTPPKPPPRLPPPVSQTSQIPGGVDTGTPGGSDSMQLGTPVMSNSTGERSGVKGGSAAARAAARPKPTASSVDCTKPVVPSTSDNKATPATLPKAGVATKVAPPETKTPVAPGSTRIDC